MNNQPHWLSKEQTRKMTLLGALGFEYCGIEESDSEFCDPYYLVGEGEDWRLFHFPQMFAIWFPSNEAYFSSDFPEWSDEEGKDGRPIPSEESKVVLSQVLEVMRSVATLDPIVGIQLELILGEV